MDNNIYKSQVITDADGNIGQLLKTDAKFYAIHVSPSEKEFWTMGEQAEAMKRYILMQSLHASINRITINLLNIFKK